MTKPRTGVWVWQHSPLFHLNILVEMPLSTLIPSWVLLGQVVGVELPHLQQQQQQQQRTSTAASAAAVDISGSISISSSSSGHRQQHQHQHQHQRRIYGRI